MVNHRHLHFNSAVNEENEVNDFSCQKGVHAAGYHVARIESRGHEDEPFRYVPEKVREDEDASSRLYPVLRLVNSSEHFSTLLALLELPFEPADDEWDIFQQLWDFIQSVPANHGIRVGLCSLGGAVVSPVALPAAVLDVSDSEALVGRFGLAGAGAVSYSGSGSGVGGGGLRWEEMLPLDRPGALLYGLSLL